MRKNLVFTFLVIGTMMFSLSVYAVAGQHGEGGAHHQGGFIGKKFLNSLSKEQKTKVAEILSKYKGEMDQHRDAFATAAEKVADAVHADTFDEAQIRQAFKDASAIREEMTVLRARIMSEIRPLLTADQLKKLKEHHDLRKQKMKERRDAKEDMFDEWLEENMKQEGN